MKNEAIDFLLFTVKQTKDSVADVTIDLYAREYIIVITDLYGQTLEPEIGGRLRRKSVESFSEKLEDLDIVSWPRTEKGTLPIHLKAAKLMFVIDDEMYHTDGDGQKGLAILHKEMENLVNTTFGSYTFY